MNIEFLRTYLLWCTIVNAVLLASGFLLVASAGDFVYRMHTRWFPMPRETFNATIYAMLGIYKVIFLVFNAVPCIALFVIA